MRLKEGESVQDHVKAITEIFNELLVIGDNIDDADRVVYLLASLPDSYEMLVTALEASVEVPNMETAIEWLLHEERKMKEKDQRSISAATPQEVMSVRHKKRGLRCYFCNKLGHKQQNCYMICTNEKRSWD